MTLDDYQQLAARTIRPGRPAEQALANWALGLTGEAGEVAEHVKKHLFHGAPLDRAAVVKELGDILWYVAAMAGAVGASLDEIGTTNVEKLRLRYPEGFDERRSLNRAADDL
ncbi:nucleoside triphosphate pyrophosphohydrolase family protein [Roseisolibacter sp. H3M3-2]|uniref:nucleoside triphosphate pyrophosphohydrolase family protein n=1 Tax=Roseisolibacter sp. H3M3-2 TaxID=3031323 RepID=UPI0023D9FA6C|nr:nucleoside triphosphate pyrophosphohydrolase family protein [Roseisolibacter sp. H3M3-2]MDF1502815.1 nucleoside triphosphate pyrophosphohydrolase family protein [Roseisolibacter sp. H3M3-2]